MKSFIFAALFIVLTACAPQQAPSVYHERDRSSPQDPGPRPDFPGWGMAVGAQPIPWATESLAEDFVELAFYSEWGQRSDRLLRWERPVRVAMVGEELTTYHPELEALIARIAAGAPGLDLAMTETAGTAQITLRSVPRKSLAEAAPTALCIFTPFRGDWEAYLKSPARGGAAWARLARLEAITIFIPANAAPHEIRACIAEEVTQAVGLHNDLYRLGDSIFNDDNAHHWPTSFDHLMIRVLYDDGIRSGMGDEDARRAARAALSRPGVPAHGATRRARRIEDDVYTEFRTNLLRAGSFSRRRTWAERMIAQADVFGPEDHRKGDAAVMAGRLAYRMEALDEAVAHLREAERLLARRGADDLRLARARGYLGAYLKEQGQARDALAALDAALPVLAANALERDLAHALRWRAGALRQLGRDAEASAAARQALEWGRWAYGRDSKAVAAWREEMRAVGISF